MGTIVAPTQLGSFQDSSHLGLGTRLPRQHFMIGSWNNFEVSVGDGFQGPSQIKSVEQRQDSTFWLISYRIYICIFNWRIIALQNFVLCQTSTWISHQFSCSVMPYSLWPHESQHPRPPCPSPTPEVHPNSCPSSQWCHPAISSSVIPQSLSPIPPSIRVFSNESTLCMRWPKYWSFSFNISPSKEHPGLTSFGMDWLDLLAVQGILKSLLQNHSSKASIHRCSAFFTVQLSHDHRKNHNLN